jgi:drug/metabolite transporter (DMT)-like permease
MIASIFALFGVMIIVMGSLDSIHLTGDLLALWMTIGMATYLCVYRRYPDTPSEGPAILLSLLLVPIAWIMGDPLTESVNEIAITCVFGLVFSVALAEGARRLPASETALLSALETPLAPIWAMMLFAELPGAYTWVGGGLVLVAAFGAELARISHHRSTAAALCGTSRNFLSVRALNSMSTMPAHSSVAKDT